MSYCKLKQPLDLDAIRSMYVDQQLGTPYIAAKMLCSSGTVYRFLQKNRIPIRPQKEAASITFHHPIIIRMPKQRTFDDATEKEIARKYQEYGVNSVTLAKEYGCHKVVVRRLLKRQGVPTKSRKQRLGDKFAGENNPNFGNHDAIAGEKSSNWIADRTALKANLHDSIRKSHEYLMWRTSISQRDNYTCVLCKHRGGKLEVHHLIPLREIISFHNIQSYEAAVVCKELFEESNGVTMCRTCHDQTKWKESLYFDELKEAINQ